MFYSGRIRQFPSRPPRPLLPPPGDTSQPCLTPVARRPLISATPCRRRNRVHARAASRSSTGREPEQFGREDRHLPHRATRAPIRLYWRSPYLCCTHSSLWLTRLSSLPLTPLKYAKLPLLSYSARTLSLSLSPLRSALSVCHAQVYVPFACQQLHSQLQLIPIPYAHIYLRPHFAQ